MLKNTKRCITCHDDFLAIKPWFDKCAKCVIFYRNSKLTFDLEVTYSVQEESRDRHEPMFTYCDYGVQSITYPMPSYLNEKNFDQDDNLIDIDLIHDDSSLEKYDDDCTEYRWTSYIIMSAKRVISVK